MTDDFNLEVSVGQVPDSETNRPDNLKSPLLRSSRSSDHPSFMYTDAPVFCSAYHRLSLRVASIDKTSLLLKSLGIADTDVSHPLVNLVRTPISLGQDHQQPISGQHRHKNEINSSLKLAFFLKDHLAVLHKAVWLSSQLNYWPSFESKIDKDEGYQKVGRMTHQLISLTKPNRSKREQEIVDKTNESLITSNQKHRESLKQNMKDWVALQRCEAIQNNALKPVHCKMCEEIIEVDVLADHSFACFERQLVYREIAKINKLIVKLSTTCGKLRTKLLYPLKITMSSPKRKGIASRFSSQTEIKLNFSKSITEEFDQTENNSPLLHQNSFKNLSEVFTLNSKQQNNFIQRAFTMEPQEEFGQSQILPTFTPQSRGTDRRSLNSFKVIQNKLGSHRR